MRYAVLLLIIAALTYSAGRQFDHIEKRFDSLQADINLLNMDVQRLDDAINRPYKSESPVRRSKYFI